VRDEIRELGTIGHPVIARERDGVVAAIVENRRRLLRANASGPAPSVAPLELDRWVLWTPNPTIESSELRVGSLREGPDGESLGVPCVVPLEPGRSIVIVSRTDRQRDAARALWQGLVTRLAALDAGRSELVLLDPTGSSFPRGHGLFTRVVTGTAIPAELDRWRADTEPSPSRWLAVCDVPAGLSQRDAALLLAMVRAGRRGATMILHLDEDAYRNAIGEPDLGDDSNRWLVDIGDAGLVDDDVTIPVIWDEAPSPALLELIADRLASS